MMNDNRETISYHEFVDVQQEEITREVNNLNNGISPMLMLARRLENNYITREDAIRENIARYEQANGMVPNTISQQEIDNLWAAYEVSEIEIEILEVQITALENLDR